MIQEIFYSCLDDFFFWNPSMRFILVLIHLLDYKGDDKHNNSSIIRIIAWIGYYMRKVIKYSKKSDQVLHRTKTIEYHFPVIIYKDAPHLWFF